MTIAGSIHIAPRRFLEAERCIEADSLFIVGINLERKLTLQCQSMRNQCSAGILALVRGGNEYPADKAAQQADEVDSLARMIGNPRFCSWKIFFLINWRCFRSLNAPMNGCAFKDTSNQRSDSFSIFIAVSNGLITTFRFFIRTLMKIMQKGAVTPCAGRCRHMQFNHSLRASTSCRTMPQICRRPWRVKKGRRAAKAFLGCHPSRSRRSLCRMKRPFHWD